MKKNGAVIQLLFILLTGIKHFKIHIFKRCISLSPSFSPFFFILFLPFLPFLLCTLFYILSSLSFNFLSSFSSFYSYTPSFSPYFFSSSPFYSLAYFSFFKIFSPLSFLLSSLIQFSWSCLQ